MSKESSGFRPPRLEGYSVELEPSLPTASLAAVGPEREVRVILHGENFVARAMPLVIMIGGVPVSRYQIAPDQNSVVCFLDEMPEDGSVISVGYGGEERVELPERFSQSRVSGGDTA